VAGVAAALAAARAGCRVTLVERNETLGGTAVRGLLGTLCGLHRNGGDEPGALLNGGILGEIVGELATRPPHPAPLRIGKVFVLQYGHLQLQEILAELCRREGNLTLRTGASVIAATARSGRVTGVTVRTPGGEQTYEPRAAVDASGDGDLSALAGAGFELSPPEVRQLGGVTILLNGVGEDESLGIKVPLMVARGVETGTLGALLRLTTFSRGLLPDEGRLKVSLPDTPARGEGELRALGDQLLQFLARELPAFRRAAIAASPTRIFPREGRRITGGYRLTAEDILSGRKFDDGVVRGAWPMELWEPGKGASYRYPADGDHYDIPLRCLTVEGFTNLFTAGRCISVSRDALGSTRVIGCCIPLGEQAGLAGARLCRQEH
jgi:hypothetical protein